MGSPTSTPIFVNCRDRLESLLALLDFLERAGQEQIYLLDNDSTYPPLLEYYETTSHKVLRLGANFGRLALWDANVLTDLSVSGAYVFTDPDIVPDEACPLDAIEYFGEILEAYPDYLKVGFGLRLDDLPDSYPFKREVLIWEAQFWERALAPGLYAAPIDTTFALYRRAMPAGFERSREFERSIRTGYPYVARHTPWYADEQPLSADEVFYRSRAEGSDVNHWGRPELPEWLADAVADRGQQDGMLRRIRRRLGRRSPDGADDGATLSGSG